MTQTIYYDFVIRIVVRLRRTFRWRQIRTLRQDTSRWIQILLISILKHIKRPNDENHPLHFTESSTTNPFENRPSFTQHIQNTPTIIQSPITYTKSVSQYATSACSKRETKTPSSSKHPLTPRNHFRSPKPLSSSSYCISSPLVSATYQLRFRFS